MVYVRLTNHVMKWGENNNVREWGRFKMHHKADRNEFRYTDNIMYIKKLRDEWCADERKMIMECEGRVN